MQVRKIFTSGKKASSPMTTKTVQKRNFSLAQYCRTPDRILIGEFRPTEQELTKMARLGAELILNTDPEKITYRTWK